MLGNSKGSTPPRSGIRISNSCARKQQLCQKFKMYRIFFNLHLINRLPECLFPAYFEFSIAILVYYKI
jgi:hypothetical protein